MELPYPDERSAVCSNPTSNRGWWSSRFNARFILYDPMDLIKVATENLNLPASTLYIPWILMIILPQSNGMNWKC